MSIIHKDESRVIGTGFGETIYKLSESMKSAQATRHDVAYVEIEPGKATKKHVHPKHEETYYIIAGIGRMILDDKESIVKPGDLILIKDGVAHKLTNISQTEKLQFVATCAPCWTDDCLVYLE